MNNDCTADFSDPVGSFSVTDRCSSWRAVRAFLVLAILASALAFLCLYLASFMKLPYRPLRRPALVLSFLAGLFGLIAWAVFISASRDTAGYNDRYAYDSWDFGFSFALLTAAWPLTWLSLLFAAIPFPYHPYAYDRSRYMPEATEEQREAERQRALREGGVATGAGTEAGVGAGLWRMLGLTPDKRQGYAEKWGGYTGAGAEKRGEAEAAREREKGAEKERREERGAQTSPQGAAQGAQGSYAGAQGRQQPPGMVSPGRAGTDPSEVPVQVRHQF